MSQITLHRSQFTSEEISHLLEDQKDFFKMGKTFELRFRKEILQQLKQLIKQYEPEILKALEQDLGKPAFEAYASEIGFVYEDLSHTLNHLKSWARPKRVSSPISSWPSRSYVIPQPKGCCLIIAPWNYPFMLLLSPLIAAIAAGNTAVLKPSEQSPHTSNLVSRILTEHFDQELICVLQGEGHVLIPQLLEAHRFDHIFFTGSTEVGRSIALQAAQKLSPVTLELGGKSPAIVDETAKLNVAARRIAFGKWLNAGQTCVAPDYLLVHRSVHEAFLKELKTCIEEFYPEGALQSESYASIIHDKHLQRMQEHLKSMEIYFGGKVDLKNRRMEPTLVLEPAGDSSLMQEEIFGPILPIIAYDFNEEAREIIEARPKPLAFYLFSSDKKNQAYWEKLPYGGGAINNAIIHLANPNLPFGGIGNSGIGAYHGKFGFDTFSHPKALMKSGTWLDLKMKYPPYSPSAYKIIKRLFS